MSIAVLVALGASACADKIGGAPLVGDGGAQSLAASGDRDASAFDGGRFGNADPTGIELARDAAVAVDAFFADDPPPAYCGPDASRPDPKPRGTPQCPEDKKREGCPCPTAGTEAACWPGKRAHRDRGICRDGTTVCTANDEFGPRWGPCEGYVLPATDAGAGPQACGCFSRGTWAIDNLAPCISTPDGGEVYIYSSERKPDGTLDCGNEGPVPHPEGDWSDNSLRVDCAGQFELCFTIKAGDADDPREDDCVIMQHCVEVWYPEAGIRQPLPPIPAWRSTDDECARQFQEGRGYGEMSVLGQSVDCQTIDDGHGDPYVFHRTDYCPTHCQQTPDAPDCRQCRIGAEGMFGP